MIRFSKRGALRDIDSGAARTRDASRSPPAATRFERQPSGLARAPRTRVPSWIPAFAGMTAFVGVSHARTIDGATDRFTAWKIEARDMSDTPLLLAIDQGHHQLARDRVRRPRRDSGRRPARVHAALPGRRLGRARPGGAVVRDPGRHPRGARRGRRGGRRDRHHQPARDHGGLGPRERRADPPRHRMAGPSHRGALPGATRGPGTNRW